MDLDFGWARKPFSEQLAGTYYELYADQLSDDADAILRLHIRGLITDKSAKDAVRRAVRRMEREMSPRAVATKEEK